MKTARWCIAALACAALAAGCGGSDDNGSEAATATSAQTTASAQSVEPAPTTPPTEIPVTRALSRTPPSGKKVTFMQCEFATCARYVPSVKAATEALGWSADFKVFKAAAIGSALDQAIAEKPDYIGLSAIPSAAIKPQLAAAAKAGIPVLAVSAAEQPAEGGYTVVSSGTLQQDADYIMRWVINDSRGSANVVAVTVPQYPIFATATDHLKTAMSEQCAECGYDELALSPEEAVSGTIPQKLVGYLQSHPETNYVFFAFSDLATGVPEALQAAGMADRVKLTGVASDTAIAKQIGDGHAAWVPSPNGYSVTTLIDSMARLSVGDPVEHEAIAQWPTFVIDSSETAKAVDYNWEGPDGYLEQFDKLWNVSN